MFKPEFLQIVVFLSDLHIADSNKDSLITDITTQSDGFFALQTALALPQEAPREMPRLIFSNLKTQSSLQISPSQLNFLFKAEKEDLSYYIKIVSNVADKLAEKHNLASN